MQEDKIVFEGIEFKTPRQFMLWTEDQLMLLQTKFLEARKAEDKLKEEKYIRKMLKYLELYASSFLKKKFRSYITNARDLQRRAYLVAEEVMLQYYQRPDFMIEHSFGGYMETKIIQILFSKKYDFSSCANYTKIQLMKLPIKNNKIFTFPSFDFIFYNSCKIYGMKYNKERDIEEDKKLLAVVDLDKSKRNIKYFKSVSDLIIEKNYINVRNKLFYINFENLKDYRNTTIEFKVRNIIKGVSLDKIIRVGAKKKVSVSFKNLLVGQKDIDISDINQKTYDIAKHIIDSIEATEDVSYRTDYRLNFHRYIALRNRIVLGEEEADKFFRYVSNDAKFVYNDILKIIKDILRKEGSK